MKRWLYFILGVAAVVSIDRWLKWLAYTGRTYDFGIGHFFLVKNDALVFSWPAPNSVGIVLMLLAVATVIFFSWRTKAFARPELQLGIALILFGAISNFYDRILFGYVIDWGYVGRWWPVFNVADMMITLGVVILLFRYTSKHPIDKTK